MKKAYIILLILSLLIGTETQAQTIQELDNAVYEIQKPYQKLRDSLSDVMQTFRDKLRSDIEKETDVSKHDGIIEAVENKIRDYNAIINKSYVEESDKVNNLILQMVHDSKNMNKEIEWLLLNHNLFYNLYNLGKSANEISKYKEIKISEILDKYKLAKNGNDVAKINRIINYLKNLK